MDVRSIGWYARDVDEKEYGPFRRDRLREYLAGGVIKADTQVRHNLEADWRPAGDVQDVSGGVTIESTGGSLDGAAKGKKKKDLEREAEGELPCGWHAKNKAITVCHRCGVPVCSKCLYKPGMWMCKSCHGSIYNRRTLAGLVDYMGLPLVLTWGPAAAFGVALGASRTRMEQAGMLLIVLIVAMSALAVLYQMFKDSLPSGRSLGKLATGLQVISPETGLPCTPVQSLQRNSLIGVSWTGNWIPVVGGVVGMVTGLWWIVDVSRAWHDPRGQRNFDKWAGTLVVDTEARLADARAKGQQRISRMAVPVA